LPGAGPYVFLGDFRSIKTQINLVIIYYTMFDMGYQFCIIYFSIFIFKLETLIFIYLFKEVELIDLKIMRNPDFINSRKGCVGIKI